MPRTVSLASRAEQRGSAPFVAAGAWRWVTTGARVLLRGRSVAFLLLVALSLGMALGGRSLLWCRWMQQLQTQCCCSHTTEGIAHDGPALERAPCCETKVLPAVQPVRTEANDHGAQVAPASLALLPPPLELPAPRAAAAVAARARERGARAGPEIPLYDLHCAYLM